MIITLCGSARFESYWHEANKQLGLAGHICYSIMTFPSIEGDKSWYTPDQKWTLDLAHLSKIEESDGVVMLNIEKYLGESSLRELEWARMRNKSVYWTLSDPRARMYETYARLLATFHTIKQSGDWIELLDAVKAKEETKAK